MELLFFALSLGMLFLLFGLFGIAFDWEKFVTVMFVIGMSIMFLILIGFVVGSFINLIS